LPASEPESERWPLSTDPTPDEVAAIAALP